MPSILTVWQQAAVSAMSVYDVFALTCKMLNSEMGLVCRRAAAWSSGCPRSGLSGTSADVLLAGSAVTDYVASAAAADLFSFEVSFHQLYGRGAHYYSTYTPSFR